MRDAFTLTSYAASASLTISPVLGSLDEIPLELLFLQVEKPGHEKTSTAAVDKDDWMPLYPGHGRLDVQSKMSRTSLGYILDVKNNSAVSVFTISSIANSIRQFRLSSYVEYPNTDTNETERQYWIEDSAALAWTHMADEDREVCIIFHSAVKPKCPGARFFVSKAKGGKIFLQYDCAVQVSRATNFQCDPGLPSFRARVPPIDSVLVLEHGLLPRPPSCCITDMIFHRSCVWASSPSSTTQCHA